MLELDTLFQEYLSRYGDQLDTAALDDLEGLLAMQDQDLFDAFSGKQALKDDHLDELFREIKLKISGAADSKSDSL